MNETNERFNQAISYLKEQKRIYNYADLSKILEKQKSYITEVRQGKRNVSRQLGNLFCMKFPEISLEWLTTGKGNMLHTEQDNHIPTAKERINTICQYYNLTINSLGKSIELPRAQALYDILQEKTKNITDGIAYKITRRYPEISRAWLMSGEGDMFNSKPTSNNKIMLRLKEFIDQKGISISAFEQSIGMGNASFGKSLKNGGSIGSDKLERIMEIYPDLSPEWLLNGEGEMSKENVQPPAKNPLYEEYLNIIRQQAEEIGKLKEQLRQLMTDKTIEELPAIDNQDNQTVKERLISYIKYKGLTKHGFEKACGLSSRYVSNISVSIQPDKIKKISRQFPDLNTGWLFTGEGTMLKID